MMIWNTIDKIPNPREKHGNVESRWYWVTILERGKRFVEFAQVRFIGTDNHIPIWYDRHGEAITYIGSPRKVIAWASIRKPHPYYEEDTRNEHRRTHRRADRNQK